MLEEDYAGRAHLTAGPDGWLRATTRIATMGTVAKEATCAAPYGFDAQRQACDR
jgi:hypothetical protein